MKRKALLAFASTMLVAAASATDMYWMVGAYNSNKMIIDGSATTTTTFNPLYELRLMYLGEGWSYSESLGFSAFTLYDTAVHLPAAGEIEGSEPIADDSSLNGHQWMMALFEKASGKYYFVSETAGGAGIEPYTMENLSDDPFENGPPMEFNYFPVSSTGFFYKGAEIPPFCVWLAKHDLVQADLAGLDADLVNQAFAVGANPTNFTSVSLAVGDVSFGANSITGGLSLVARDGAQNATAVTRLNGDAALSLLSSTTLGGVTSALPATFNLANGTFDSTVGATNATQFLRLKLAVPDVW
ncbi:MAG: hypothetical protein PHW08_03440 [Kiritimatiellae bacterium]|nr:hypothetical protein [Kiritimatiellia bacterium]